jgi:hypothetical protein
MTPTVVHYATNPVLEDISFLLFWVWRHNVRFYCQLSWILTWYKRLELVG